MAQVKGTMNVTVTISKKEAFDALCEELGIYHMIYPNKSEYYVLEDNAIKHYEDISYHGSPQYELKGINESENTVNAYKHMIEIQKLLSTTPSGV